MTKSFFRTTLWLGTLLSVLALPLRAQLINGKTPFDKFVDSFWSGSNTNPASGVNTNANSLALGTKYATAPFTLKTANVGTLTVGTSASVSNLTANSVSTAKLIATGTGAQSAQLGDISFYGTVYQFGAMAGGAAFVYLDDNASLAFTDQNGLPGSPNVDGVLYLDGNGVPLLSAVTPAELYFTHGVRSSIQNQLDNLTNIQSGGLAKNIYLSNNVALPLVTQLVPTGGGNGALVPVFEVQNVGGTINRKNFNFGLYDQSESAWSHDANTVATFSDLSGGDVTTAQLLAASNAVRTTFVANDTTTSNGLFSAETTRNASVSNALAALLVANDTITSNAVWAATTNLFVGTNVLYVAKNGNDSTGQRNRRDLPFLSLGAANTNAFTNDTIFVSPGTWNEKIALRNMVNWHFDEGAIISATNSFRSSPTNHPGAIFDDYAGNTTNRITGYGRFEDLTVSPFFYSGVVNMTNQSFITLICDSAYSASAVGTASSDNDLMDGRAGSVFYQSGKSNKLVVECRLTRAGLASYGVWWRGGEMRLQSQEIVGDTNNTGIVVASDVGTFSGATNVQMFVRAQRIAHLGTNGVTTYTDSPTIYVSNGGADVRSWINAEYIESVGGAAIHANAGKYYINAQKILGAINDDNAGTTSEAYITAEKLATDNLFLSRNQPLIVSKSSKPQFYNFQVIEESGITNAPIITHSGNGSAVFNGGWITRTNTGSIYYHTGTGTGVLSSVNFMAKSGETSISNSAGTLVVEGSYYGTTAGTITFQPEIAAQQVTLGTVGTLASNAVANLNGKATNVTAWTNIFLGSNSVITNNDATTNVYMGPMSRNGGIYIGPGGNVGVGTNNGSPTAPLSIQGAALGTTANPLSALRIENLQGTIGGFVISAGQPGVVNAGFSIYDGTALASRFFINASGSVGIGTTTPAALLDIAGTQNSYLLRVNTNTLVVTNGNVGVGTNNPQAALHVAGQSYQTTIASGFTNLFVVNGRTNSLFYNAGGLGMCYDVTVASAYTLHAFTLADNILNVPYLAATYNVTAGRFHGGAGAETTVGFPGSPDVFIDAQQLQLTGTVYAAKAVFTNSVGIGTASPGYKLHVAGDAYLPTNTAPFTVVSNAPAVLITNRAQRATLVLKLAFDDVTGGIPSCTINATNTASTNYFGQLSPSLSGFTLVGTVSLTNDYSYPMQTNAIFQITDTSTGGAAVRVVQALVFEQ